MLAPALLVLLGSAAAVKDDAPATTIHISLREAVSASRSAPRIVAATESAAAASHRASSLWGLPAIEGEILPGAQIARSTGITPAAQTTWMLPFPLANVSGAERAALDAESALATAEAEDLAYLQGRSVITLWFARREAQMRVDHKAEALLTLEKEREQLKVAEQLGDKNQLDALELDAFISEVRAEWLDAIGRRTEAGLALARALGRPTELGASDDGDDLFVNDKPFITAITDDAEQKIEQALLAAPHTEVAWANAQAHTSEALRAHAAVAQAPVLSVGVAGQIDNRDTGFAYARIAITLPRFDKNPVEDTRLVAERLHAQAAQKEALQARAIEALLLAHEHTHTRELEREVSDQLLPLCQARVAKMEARLKLGDTTWSEVLRARRALLSAEERQAAAVLSRRQVDALTHHLLAFRFVAQPSEQH